MVCPNCGTENRAEAEFCGGCGQTLARTCPACGTANDPGMRFCNECGSALDAAPAPNPGPSPIRTAAPTAERTELQRAEWLAADGRHEEAEAPLAEARATFERLEARPWLERAVQAASAGGEPAVVAGPLLRPAL